MYILLNGKSSESVLVPSGICHAASGPPPQLIQPNHPWQIWLPYVDGLARPSKAAMDGPPCHKWSPHLFCCNQRRSQLKFDAWAKSEQPDSSSNMQSSYE